MCERVSLYADSVPSVSIVLPTLNRKDCLSVAIESVLRQDFFDWELIVIDDGSSDDSMVLVQEYVCKDSRVRYVGHSNRGASCSRNVGVRLAEGEYVTFLDSDDHYLPEHVRLRYEHMQTNPKLGLIHGGFRVLGDPYVVCREDSGKLVHLDSCCVGATLFCRRWVLCELGGFRDLRYSADGDFLERAEELFEVEQVGFATYIYDRSRSDSITNRALQKGHLVGGVLQPQIGARRQRRGEARSAASGKQGKAL